MEIKVKAWDKISSQMVNVKVLDLFKGRVGLGWNEYDGITWRNIEDVELVQYMGLKDKNGKEIYEGDIIKFYNQVEYITGYIAFDHGIFCLKIYNPDETCYNPWIFRAKEVEVIGNMFENFDLFNLCLKEAKDGD